jgi:cytochrome c oxidase assembly protein Cox11
MMVRFEVDKELPEDVEELTLSYTFFRVKKVAAK